MSLQARINPVLRHSLRELLRRPPLAAAMLGVPGFALSGMAMAGPTGEDVIRGSAHVTRPDAQHTNITQTTDRAVINWQTFNVDADEFVTFFQPGASSIVLNRVLGGDASYILGHIEANGQVFLLNPQGVFFTHGASLDVQGFLGSTLDMDPDAFMAGDFSLTRNGASPTTAQVINDGTITAGPGGYVVLAGDFTENTGVITANAGTVALVSGNALTLDIEGDGLVNFAVSEATLSEAAGVRNAGSLIADGGRVIMTAKVANDLVATAVNNEGLVRAHSIEERDGEIYLVGNGGDVVNSGTLDADGENADGGRMLVRSDRDVILAEGGVQTAAGDENHEGGMLRFIAEEHLDYQQDNTIRATGGSGGGFVEVSGHGSIALRGIPNIGPGGTFYIDPSSITIYNGTGSGNTPAGSVGTIEDAYIQRQLNNGVNVILAAFSNITANSNTSINATGTGDLTVGIGTISGGSAGICEGLGSSFCFGPGVTFQQNGSGNIDLTNLALNVGGNLLIDAGNGGTVSAGDLVTTDGNITVFGGNIMTGMIDAGAGLNNAGDVTLGSSLRALANLNAGPVSADGNIQARTNSTLGGNGLAIAGNIDAGGNVSLNAEGNGSVVNPNINVGGAITAGGSIDIVANGASFLGGDITVAAGLFAGGNISLAAISNADRGGNITINGGGIRTTGGSITLFGTAGNISGGNISVVGAGTVGVVATNGITIDASANGGAPTSTARNANIDITGQVRSGAGMVDIRAGTATQGGSGANVLITGTGGSAGLISGASISVIAAAAFGAGTGANSGQIHLGSGVPETNFDGAQVTATTGNVVLTAVGGRAVITAGDVNAVGSASIGVDGVQGHVHLGDYTSSTLTAPGNITAGTYVTVNATGNDARIDAGNITGGNAMNLGAFVHPGGSAAITVGSLTNNGAGSAGNISVSVGATSSGLPVSGALTLDGITAAHNVTLNITTDTGSFHLDNLNGADAALTINTSVGGDIGFVNVAGDFNFNASGSDVDFDFVGDVGVGGNLYVNARQVSTVPGVTMIAVNGDATFSNGALLISGTTLDAGGNVYVNVSGSAGNVNIGDVSGADINISANGSTAGQGNVALGNVTGTGLVNISADGGGSIGGGEITTGNVTGGSVMLNAYAEGGTGGRIVVSGSVISTTGDIDLYASNFTGNGVIKLLSTADAAGSFFARATGAGTGDVIEIHGDLLAGNNLDFGSGVDHLVFSTGTHTISAGGNVHVNNVQDMVNGGSVNYIATGDVFVSATDVLIGNVTAGGRAQINGNGGTTHTIGDVSANHIDMHFGPPSGGTVNVTTGDLTATGTASFNRDIVVQMHGGSMGTSANLTLGNVTTANGEAVLTVFEGASGSGAGNLTVGTISAERFARLVARGDVTTGAITINNAAGAANLQIQSHTGSSSAAVGGDITINGNLSVTGRGEALNPHGGFVRLDAGAGTSTITVTGDISVTVAANAFSFSTTDSSGNPVTMSGSMGIGGVQMHTRFGTVDLGNVNVNTVGEGFIDVQALHVSAGDVTLAVADGSFTRETMLTSCGGSPCNITRTETTTANGRGEVHLGYYGVAIDGTLDFGNVTVSAGDARFGAYGFAGITGNAITVNATGGNLTQASTGTFAGNAINYTETGNGGGAEVSLRTTPAGSVTLTGAVNVNAQGRGLVNIGAADVSLKDVTVTATGGTFTRTGQPVPQPFDDGPFGDGMDNGGPRIDEGTITGGMAGIHIGGVPASSSTTSGEVLANNVTVNGTLSVSAPGNANIHIAGNNIAVTGALVAAGGAVVQDGTRFEEYVDSTGDTIKVASVVQSSYGEADVSLNGSAAGVINVGDITVSGPVAGGHVEGGDITLGALTVTGTGGDLHVEETTTNITAGTVTSFTFDGPALLSGFGIRGAGAVTVGGDIALSAVGAGGMIIAGDSINLQNVTLNVTDGNYEILDTGVFGATAHAFTLGDALLDIDAATTATVNGNVSVTAGHTARVGGAYTATGTIDIDAGKDVTSAISTEIQYLHAIDDEGESDPLVLSGPMNIAAAGAAITAGGSIDLSGTVITVGTGNAPGGAADAQLLSLLTTEGLAPTSSAPNLFVRGTNVTLGDLAFNGDYLRLEANTLTLAGAVTTSQSDTLVQLAPLAASSTISVLESGGGTGTTDYSNAGHLGRFAGDTIALGTTGHTGNITLAENGTGIDIGTSNLFVLTSGTVTGLDRVTSSGVVKDLATLLGGGGFDVPQTGEIDTSQDVVQTLNEEYALEDRTGSGSENEEDEDEGDEEGEDTDTDATVEEEGDSLIRQDTVDEEMMCS